MEILWLLCKGTALVTLTLFILTILYAVTSTLIQNILRDCKNIKKYEQLKKDYQELLEKVQRLEIELIDKKLAKEYNDDKRTKNWVLSCFSFPREKSLGFFRLFYEKCLTY